MSRWRGYWLAGLLALLVPVAQAVDPDELLPVDDAFKLSASASQPQQIDLHWAIAEGYYLYRHATRLKVLDDGFVPKTLHLPNGHRHTDEFFGEVETYRGALSATLPGYANAASTQLEIRYQGCADLGVCYPPQTRTLSVALPMTAVPSGNGLATLQQSLGARFPVIGGGGNAPLPPEQAFGFEAIAEDGNTLRLRLTPAPGYYLYQARNTFRLDGADGMRLGDPQWPPAQAYFDEHFGEVAVYFDQVDVPLPVLRGAGEALNVTLHATFQGCQDGGICYPPITRQIALRLPASTGPVAQDASADNHQRSAAPPAPARMSASALILALGLALLGGMVLNLMPCVLPVLSLKVLGLARSGESRAAARRSALWYGTGVVSTFAMVGLLVVALRSGGQALGWGFQLQQPWFVAVLAYVMFAVGLSLSGLFTLGGSGRFGQVLAEKPGVAGDFFTGMLACVVASPCIAPFMGGALAYALAAPVLVSLLVFLTLGFGLALPFLLIGYVPALAARLPKPGAWMDTLKQLLAFPMYLAALWLLWILGRQRGVDALALVACGLLLLALGLWWFERSRWHSALLQRGLAATVVLASLLPVLLLPSLPTVPTVAANQLAHDAYDPIRLHTLRNEGRTVFVNMTADWCVTCKLNEARVLSRPTFQQALEAARAVYLVGDWTNTDPTISAFLEQHHAVGVPLYVVYRNGGEGRVLPAILNMAAVEAALQGTGG